MPKTSPHEPLQSKDGKAAKEPTPQQRAAADLAFEAKRQRFIKDRQRTRLALHRAFLIGILITLVLLVIAVLSGK